MTVFLIGENTGDDYSGTADSYLYSSDVNGSDSGIYIESGYYPIIKFSGISSLPAGTINSATMYLYQEWGYGSCAVAFRRCLRNWVETQANNSVYSTGNSWGATCGTDSTDRVDTAIGTMSLGNSSGYKSLSVTTDVEDFYDGTYSDYGWHGTRTSGGGLVTSRSGSDGQRPYLSVDITEASGGHPTASRFRGIDRNNNVRYA